MEKVNKNGIKQLSEADLLQMVLDKEDQDRQAGFSSRRIVIEMSQAEDRATGQHSGRA